MRSKLHVAARIMNLWAINSKFGFVHEMKGHSTCKNGRIHVDRKLQFRYNSVHTSSVGKDVHWRHFPYAVMDVFIIGGRSL